MLDGHIEISSFVLLAVSGWYVLKCLPALPFGNIAEKMHEN
jgi:hypothetical protein